LYQQVAGNTKVSHAVAIGSTPDGVGGCPLRAPGFVRAKKSQSA